MRTIAIVGPESSGKTTLADSLTKHYGGVLVKEFARTELEARGPGYVEEDLLVFAHGQVHALEEGNQLAQRTGSPLVVCDTDLINLHIWGKEVFGRSHHLIEEMADQVVFDHWLLCRPDMPWEPDPLRENPHDRDRLFDIYLETLDRLGKPFTMLVGDQDRRMRMATTLIDALLATEQK